jgi:VanZ family protein
LRRCAAHSAAEPSASGFDFMSTSYAAPAQHRRLRLLAAAAVLYWLALIMAMHIPLKPRPHVPDGGIPKDKTVHFTLYAGLAVCLISVLEQRSRVDSAAQPRRTLSRYLAVMAFCTAHGYIEELTQPLTGRTYDLYDVLADCLGASLGLVGFFVVSRTLATMRKREAAS